jgi:hypothetical protein
LVVSNATIFLHRLPHHEMHLPSHVTEVGHFLLMAGWVMLDKKNAVTRITWNRTKALGKVAERGY